MLKDLFWIYVLTGTFLSIYGDSRNNTIDIITVFCFIYIAYNIYKDKAFFEKDLDEVLKLHYNA